MRHSIFVVIALAASMIVACDDEEINIGKSLTAEADVLDATPETFDITTATVVEGAVLSLSNDCYLGCMRDPETKNSVKSEFTTQFHLLEHTYVSPEDSIVGRADNRAAADSCDVVLFLSTPYSSRDSLTAMKMRVLELDKPLSEGTKYYSDFDPRSEGKLSTLATKMFTYEDLNISDSARALETYLDNIRIPLNHKYTDRNGNQYSNFGTYILRQYYDHPEYFRNSYTFAHNVCPGLFFTIVDGMGFHSKISNIGLRVYYRIGTDSIQNKALTIAATKEVLQTTKVTNDNTLLNQLAAETQFTYIKSPAGLCTEVTIPVSHIKSGHESDSLISAKLAFQKLNSQTSDYRTFGTPSNLLLIEKDSLAAFFENNKLPDNITSYYATYSSLYNTYTFTNLSNLVNALYKKRQEGIKRDANWEQNHPNWNKMLLVPVTIDGYTSSSQYVLTGIEHDMSLTSVKLVGGSTPGSLKMSVVFARYRK